MIFHYDISEALEDGIVKSIVVYEPEVKLLELTYTNFQTREKKVVAELSEEFRQAEEGLKPFQWILDNEPMRKQMAIALQRLELVEGPKGEIGPSGAAEMTREQLEDQFKAEVKDVATGLLIEAGFGGMKKGQLYGAIMDHIRDKVFGGRARS